VWLKTGADSVSYSTNFVSKKQPNPIAVCNKLLKQAFAIAKSGLAYDENFVSKLA